MADKIISGSFYIPEEARVISLWCEVLPQENTLVKGVQYQKIGDKEDIVNTVSRKSLFSLTGNPNVTRVELPDHGLMFHIVYTEPGNEISTLYRIDPDTNYVYKISHMIIQIVSDKLEPLKTVYILGQQKESYSNIIKYLQKYREDSIKGLMILVGGEYIPLVDLDPSDILPSEDPSKTL